jgi:two-component system invasion response regulator UvrY
MPTVQLFSRIYLFREGIKHVLEPHSEFCIADELLEATSPNESAIQSESMVGITHAFRGQSIREVLAKLPLPDAHFKIVLIAYQPYPEQIFFALKEGVQCILDASCASFHLPRALHVILQGRPYIDEQIIGLMTLAGSSLKQWRPRHLSPREKDILTRLVNGQAVSQVANILGLSTKTVSTHKTHLMQKLSVKTFAELVRYAITQRIIEITNDGNNLDNF